MSGADSQSDLLAGENVGGSGGDSTPAARLKKALGGRVRVDEETGDVIVSFATNMSVRAVWSFLFFMVCYVVVGIQRGLQY